ncbi:MAG: EAL domain-containing protein [Xanthobacteraceae bacterium]
MTARPSLQRKLVVLVIAAVGAAVAVSTTITLWQQAADYGALRRQALTATAHVFAAAVSSATAAQNAKEAFFALRAVGKVPDIHYAEIRTPGGQVLASLGQTSRLLSDLTLEGNEPASVIDLLTSTTMQVAVPILSGGSQVGRIILVGGISDLRSRLLSTLAFTFLGGLVALMAGLIVAWRFQQAITRPLQVLVRAMERIRRDHRYDVSVPNAPDREIGELVDGFNQMLRDVRDRDEHLAAHRRNLEHEVTARTQELREARDAAEMANVAKSEFLATMSHEIRTPLNGMMVMAELMTGAPLPVRQRRFADIIVKSGQSLLAIINDILDFSKIEAGKLELERRPLDLNEIAENITSLFAERARASSIDLAALVDPQVPRSITGDPVRLAQVIGNLVNNALKFTERGYVKLSVANAAGQAGRIEIRVSDTGIGIPQDKLATIFEAFSQADQSTTRQFGGTGLGLAICRRLVAAMDGEITVESQEGAGSTFSVVIPTGQQEKMPWPAVTSFGDDLRFCLLAVRGEATASALARYLAASGYTIVRQDGAVTPEQCADVGLVCADADRLATLELSPDRPRPVRIAVCPLGEGTGEELVQCRKADAVISRPILRSEIELLLQRLARGDTDLATAQPAADVVSQVTRFPPFRALVADDNAVNREVASEALSQLGAFVETVETGTQAVAAALTRGFEIVFMDASMPDMDGFAATRRIREAEAQLHRPRTVIVALTAHVIGTAADAWREAGMDDILHKPFTLAGLARTIAKLLPRLAAGATSAIDRGTAPGLQADNAPEAEASAEVPLVDTDVVDQLRQMQARGKGDFVHKVLGLYRQHAPMTIAQMREAAALGQAEACSRAAHALKSMSYNIGARRVAELSAALERAGKLHGQCPSRAAIEEIAELVDRSLDVITASGPFRPESAAPAVTVAAVIPSSNEVERALPFALERDELFLLYQPIVDRTGSLTCGVEALVRWNRGGELVPPSIFIPVAERSGLIHDIGDWVLRRACQDAAAWPSLTVAVNVSALQFAQADFAERFGRIMSAANLDARRLEVEITESALLEAEDAVLAAMKQLSARGVGFALDDFGTGYSSLNYLRRYPVGKIKIDRSFVVSLDKMLNATIVHAVAAIGRSLGLKLVAEGVETTEQQRFLAAAGVHFMQGFLFGHPAPKQAITDRLELERGAASRALDGASG